MTRNRPYRESEELLERASRVIPLGTQTFSKSRTQFPHGVSPYYIVGGKGARVVDADGNTYLDFISALNAITLGYADPDVDGAVRDQLDDGVLFSLPHPIEIEVAEAIRDMVPCAEMVRFGKNGSDATSAAVRLARAHTGRDHVAACGYHGWQDWYIGTTTRDRGVPKATSALTHTFRYNDLGSLEAIFDAHRGEVALVIMEAMNSTPPAPGFLDSVKDLAHRNGALLAFDEMITGFRYANGGAQEYFGVVPDLATFGKGLANGYPLSAIVGRADVMRLMEEIFFSFTFGGETLSLAAARAVLAKIGREPVVETLRSTGQAVMEGVALRIERHGIDRFTRITGHPSWSFLVFDDVDGIDRYRIKTLFLQEIFARGILSYGTHNITYAHSDDDVAQLLSVYDEVFPILADAVGRNQVDARLRCEPLVALFAVR